MKKQFTKKIIALLLSLVLSSAPLFASGTNENKTVKTYEDVKSSKSNAADHSKYLLSDVKASEKEKNIAAEMRAQGWRYVMPEPKSPQAAWGNTDGRTTWWNGYWVNKTTKQYSITTPEKDSKGIYEGDGQNLRGTWRRGGAPRNLDVYMRLLSQ